jgi:putative tricarboxylic transport membrane protein
MEGTKGNPIMTKWKKIQGESIFNLILIALGIFIILESFRVGFGSLKRPGSGLFILFCGMAILSLNGYRLFKASGTEAVFKKREAIKFLTILVPFLAWMILIQFLGYVLVTFLCTLCIAKLLDLPRWRWPLVLSLGTTAFCYLLFDHILYLDLPRGFWK